MWQTRPQLIHAHIIIETQTPMNRLVYSKQTWLNLLSFETLAQFKMLGSPWILQKQKWFFGGFYGMVSNKVLALRWTKYKHSAVIRTAPLIWPYVRHFQRLVHIKEMRKYWISVTPLVLSREAYGNVGKNGKWNKGNMEPPAWSRKWGIKDWREISKLFWDLRERERGRDWWRRWWRLPVTPRTLCQTRGSTC